jgi:UDP-N-acetyl-D-galactosamine dehydrogenase
MYSEIIERKKKIAVIGLGYVGLPIALEFAKKVPVIGFDIRQDRVDQMKQKADPSKELDESAFDNCDILFTANPSDLKEASFFIVAVPTPIDQYKNPDLRPLLSATETVGKALKEGDYVVYESTVYPGCTEEDCIPILEKLSGLKYLQQFKVGFSPERINPGDKHHTLTSIIKVTSGGDAESAEEIANVYEMIITAGVYRASSIKVAEAAKIIENTQRDINIAFMNELSMIFDKMDINTYEVLEAAGTKWNFLKFYPGLVGGHCIGVDPYYLTFKSAKFGHHARIINAGRAINDGMAAWVAQQIVQQLIGLGKDLRESKVLVLGITFKENVSDIRNSKVAEVIYELKKYALEVDVVDPYASPTEIKEEYGLELSDTINPRYDVVLAAVSHNEYRRYDEKFTKYLNKSDLIIFLNKLSG